MESKTQKAGGSLKVSEGVLARIALLAASEVEGIALEADGKTPLRGSKSPFALMPRLLSPAPVKVRLAKEAAEIDISVVIEQGHKAMKVGEKIQSAVKTAVQNMAGITVSKINVNIAGIRLAENGG
ncbi:MAG: Asp23/Gls24 family envelope stress response protein [Oscillospiraceae bacterium]|nr:Asp23/Gls24 family envelope stress response protein [Oscillospiraceae bacterium]